jgi:hypothetical protein
MADKPPSGLGTAVPVPPVWPTVEEQLAAAGVRAGTALETLIRENQDFQMLRPSEATDPWRVPPWLRVYYRRRHPIGSYSGTSPSSGYPHTLADSYDWMIAHQDLPGKTDDEPTPKRRRRG